MRRTVVAQQEAAKSAVAAERGVDQLERLIREYEDAVFDPLFSPERARRLCREVEALADAVGYADHARLYRLHTMCEIAEEAHEHGHR